MSYPGHTSKAIRQIQNRQSTQNNQPSTGSFTDGLIRLLEAVLDVVIWRRHTVCYDEQLEDHAGTLMRAAHSGLRTLLGSVACVQCLKERARNREACCLMEGFLLSITPRMSSDMFWRVVWRRRRKDAIFKWDSISIYSPSDFRLEQLVIWL